MAAAYDLIVIGAGPAGYIGAIRAAQLGFKVACIEAEPQLGGTCLRVGCIPSKTLLESSALYHRISSQGAEHGIEVEKLKLNLKAMHQRREGVVNSLAGGIAGLFKKHNITHVQGTGRLVDRTAAGWQVAVQRGEQTETLSAPRVLLATGSKEASLPGVTIDHDLVGTSTDALAYPAVPKHLVVIGAGAIGVELGSVWQRLGAKVTVLEYADRILAGMDGELARAAQRVFAKQGLQFELSCKVEGVTRSDGGARVAVAGKEPILCDKVLLAVGRVPNTAGLGLEAFGITLDPRGRVPVDKHFATQAPGLFAVGDIIQGPMLAHKAEEDAVACVEIMATGHGHVDYDLVPYVVYTAPEVASVGMSEDQLQSQSIPYKKGSFPMLANARARAVGETAGFIKILAHRDTDRILGVHMLAEHASELIAEAAALMACGASSEDLARICHAHPTLTEALREAALAVDGRTLNM